MHLTINILAELITIKVIIYTGDVFYLVYMSYVSILYSYYYWLTKYDTMLMIIITLSANILVMY